MKSFRAAVAASAIAFIAFGAFAGAAETGSAQPSGTASRSVLADGGGTNGDSGWGGRYINDSASDTTVSEEATVSAGTAGSDETTGADESTTTAVAAVTEDSGWGSRGN